MYVADATRKRARNAFLPNADTKLVERVVAEMSAAPPKVGIGVRQEVYRYGRNLPERLQKITIPMVMINSSDFVPTNIESAQKYGIEVMFMSGVGHFVMMEDSETFNRLLDAIVKRFAH